MSFSEDYIMDFHVCRPLHALHKDALFYVKSKFKSLQTVPVTFDNRPLRITESFNVLMKIMDYRMAVPYPNAPYLGMAMANVLLGQWSIERAGKNVDTSRVGPILFFTFKKLWTVTPLINHPIVSFGFVSAIWTTKAPERKKRTGSILQCMLRT